MELQICTCIHFRQAESEVIRLDTTKSQTQHLKLQMNELQSFIRTIQKLYNDVKIRLPMAKLEFFLSVFKN